MILTPTTVQPNPYLVAAAAAMFATFSGIVLYYLKRLHVLADRRTKSKDELRAECQRYKNAFFRAHEYIVTVRGQAAAIRELREEGKPGWEFGIETLGRGAMPNFFDESRPACEPEDDG